MKPIRYPASFAVMALLAVPAQAEIYKCVDTDGHVTYSNVQSKSCKKLNLDPVTSVPPPPTKAGARTPTPESFPRVAEDTQKSRDSDRRRILETELAAEEKQLDQARKDLAEQEAIRNGDERNYQKVLDRLQPFKDKVALHARNVAAIKKEIGNLK